MVRRSAAPAKRGGRSRRSVLWISISTAPPPALRVHRVARRRFERGGPSGWYWSAA